MRSVDKLLYISILLQLCGNSYGTGVICLEIFIQDVVDEASITNICNKKMQSIYATE